MLSLTQLSAIMSGLPPKDGVLFLPHLNDVLVEFEINTPARVASFLAQLAHESVHLRRWEESLNYSAAGLLDTWPKRFTPALALKLARKPVEIANHVYADRNGNGDEASGDGWLFHGRGPIQLTFRGNYRTAGLALGLPLEEHPERVADKEAHPEVGLRVAGWYWHSHGCNALADRGDVGAIRRAINGGEIGLAECKQLDHIARNVLGAHPEFSR